jgi:2-(1,2-epoxy-1,2-dihydrophenyl)acetyl-CoA isomerase
MADIEFTKQGSIGILTLTRPQKLNALTLAMHAVIFDTLRKFRTDKALKALIVTGTGRAFCAGDDMNESDPRTGLVLPEDETEIAWHNMVREMRSIPKPIIAAVNGLACGAGSGLLLASDIRIASERAQFADIFIRRGIPGGSCLLARTIGTARALELIFTGDFIDAKEGHRVGIFNRVVPPEKLMNEALALAERLASGPSESIGLSKLSVYASEGLSLSDALRMEELSKLSGLRSREVAEGIAAFNDKRSAAFSAPTATT